MRNYFFTIWLELYGVLRERYYFLVKIGAILFFLKKPTPDYQLVAAKLCSEAVYQSKMRAYTCTNNWVIYNAVNIR